MKSRFQADAAGLTPLYKNVRHCIEHSYKTEGFGVFFCGLMPTLVRAFPTNAATLTVVTLILRFVKDDDDDVDGGGGGGGGGSSTAVVSARTE